MPRKNQVNLICKHCEREYSVKASRSDKSNFCSNECKFSQQSLDRKGITPKAFERESYPYTKVAPAKECGHITKKGRKYCVKCREELYSKITIVECLTCGKEMRLSKSEKEKYKCCSFDCRNKQISKRQSGDKSHLWRGGVCNQNRIQRNSAYYNNWRKSVMDRDNYTCQLCGNRGVKLVADHIKEWFLYPALRFDLENGRTLCRDCHSKTDNFGGKAYRKMLELEVDGKLQLRLI